MSDKIKLPVRNVDGIFRPEVKKEVLGEERVEIKNPLKNTGVDYQYEPKTKSQADMLRLHKKYDHNYGDVHVEIAKTEEAIRQIEIDRALESKLYPDELKASIRKVFRNYDENGRNIGARYIKEEKDRIINEIPAFAEYLKELDIRADQQSDVEIRALEGSLKASFDERTGLKNSNVLYSEIAHEISIVKREKNPCAVIMLDLDNFKKVNDTYGHAAGDLVLKGVAQELKASVREVDQVYRYGGEEFVVLLHKLVPTKNSSGQITSARDVAKKIAEKILTSIRAAEFSVTESETISVSASMGLALSDDFPALNGTANTENMNNEELAKMMVESADNAAYFSKENGKDRLTLFNDFIA
ncbi:MAG: GGDEF domain-containing protein [bacterium]